jgi:hypothetical protein
MVVLPIAPHEGSLDQWFYSIGVMQHGLSKGDVDEILASHEFCGSCRFKLVERPWAKEWGAMPAAGPCFGVYEVNPDGKLAARPFMTLISDHGVMSHAIVPILSGQAVALIALVGSPEVIECIRSMQTAHDAQFAAFYWEKQGEVGAILRKSSTVYELRANLDGLFENVPSGAWTFDRASRSCQRFRDKAGAHSFITCELEKDLSWDEIYAIRLTQSTWDVFSYEGGYRNIAPHPVSTAQWETGLIANVYTNGGQIVAVLSRRSNYYGCVPDPIRFPCNPPRRDPLMAPYQRDTYVYWRTS